jgi:two-component system, cell cycle sensor histidine kinase and response regulator CckA
MRAATDLPPHNNESTNENSHTLSPAPRRADEGAEYSALAARATNDAVRDWDVTGGALIWPEGLETLLGYNAADVPPELSFWSANVHPEDEQRVTLSIRTALADREAQSWSGEYRFRYADGPYLHLLERAAIVRDENGNAVRFVGSLMDITARQQLQDQLCRSQKMEAFGKLAGGVAHDFNNFLTTILGYSDLLLGHRTIKGDIADHITEIQKAARRASALTSQLLAFSRKNPLEPRVVEVDALIVNLERSLFRLLGEHISVECHLRRAKEGTHVKVDPGQLTQVILNLAVNARDAMRNGGRLTLSTRVVEVTEEGTAGFCSDRVPPGDYVAISVADTGAGMSDDVKSHLFEPFFTTKHDTHGSGLGLATSYGIVRQSGGHLCVESELRRGTTVTIYLPRTAAPAYKKSSKKLPGGDERVLVLEDDVAVRHISCRILRSLGYEVMEAATSLDAQRLVNDRGDTHIDLLLTDIVMPQMSGRHFADWMRNESPATKVIFISGYLQETQSCSGDDTFFLAKPFDPEQLAGKVREALDSSSPALAAAC